MLAAAVCLLVLPSVPGLCQSDWPMYGYDESSTRFSPLDQINTKNVQNLTRAWTYHLSVATPASQAAGAVGRGGGRRSSEATPIVVKGVMYLPTPYGTIVALDPETGKELWTYKLDTGRPAQRAVSYWPGDKRTPASILFGTSDGRYISLNAETGQTFHSRSFGQNGIIDMKPGVDNEFSPNARYATPRRPARSTKISSSLAPRYRSLLPRGPPEMSGLGMCTPARWFGNFIQSLSPARSDMTRGRETVG